MEDFEKQAREVLEMLRGHLQADGGDLEIVKFDGKDIYLRLKGACGGCPHAQATLKEGIERYLREAFNDNEITIHRAE
jgi:Fe-S cluster biogenesis protein NfuA